MLVCVVTRELITSPRHGDGSRQARQRRADFLHERVPNLLRHGCIGAYASKKRTSFLPQNEFLSLLIAQVRPRKKINGPTQNKQPKLLGPSNIDTIERERERERTKPGQRTTKQPLAWVFVALTLSSSGDGGRRGTGSCGAIVGKSWARVCMRELCVRESACVRELCVRGR